jgi:hypothetical protein
MYLNSCKNTVDSWKVKAQENIMIIMFTYANNDSITTYLLVSETFML